MPVPYRKIFISRLLYACFSLLAFLAIFGSSSIYAQNAAAISQGFTTSETNVAAGALMTMKTGSTSTVELANTERVERLIGVVGDNTLLELGDQSENVQVVTSGVAQVLVSNANGEVRAGDKITASPIEGVGMKAVQSVQVIGIAQADLNSSQIQTRTVQAADGSQVQIKIGKIAVQVNVTFYVAPDDRSSFLPAFLQDFANAVSGREVSPVRVMIAALILILAFVSIAVLLYSTVKSSIISIGRNPLSEKAVRKSIFQIGGTVVGILLLTLITIYLILTT